MGTTDDLKYQINLYTWACLYLMVLEILSLITEHAPYIDTNLD